MSFAQDVGQPDARMAALLEKAQFKFPEAGAALWHRDDGLPAPDDAEFAVKAARFLGEHPNNPPDHRGPSLWDVTDIASRQCKCLAYLARGGVKARMEVAGLCVAQARTLLWTLPIRTGHGSRIDRDFYAAAASLALTGALAQAEAKSDSPEHPAAEQWLRTGMGQFNTYGAKGDAKDRAAAQALIAAPSDTAQAPATAKGATIQSLPIHASDAEFFGELDLTRPDMRAVARCVAAQDYAGAKLAYTDALSERFSRRRNWPDVHFHKTVDVAEADDICTNVFILQAHMFRRMDFGAQVDWSLVIDKDIESRVWMNAHPWMWTLLNAYHKTGDEKYVANLCRLFRSWYESSPPTFLRTDAQWRTLEAGGRTGQKWTSILLALSENPTFKRECLVDMARSMLDHGKYLSMYAAAGGNWLQVESSGLACVALLLPELKLSPVFYEVAMNRLAWVNARSFLPDGFQSECSPGYHLFPLIGIAGSLRLAKFLGKPVPDSFMRQYEAGVATLEYVAYPDRTLPMLSDFNPGRASAKEILQTGAEVFARNDFQWLATGGAQGKPPSETSHDFTHAGYCVMRDKWGTDGQVLIFDAGYFGAGHQHEDKLNFVYYAGGRELIGDPGIYSYKRDEFEPYWRGSWSHNTLLVDGLSQHRGLGPAEEMPDPDRRFVMGDGFDFASGWYRRAYSPRGSQVWEAKPGAAETKSPAKTPVAGADPKTGAIRNVQHQRCIFWVKGRYAIICDRVAGEGAHQIEVLFHPAPVITDDGIKRTVRPVELEIGAKGRVVTKERDSANVAILPAQGAEFETLDLVGQKNPVRGWYAMYGIQPSHDIVYRRRAKLPQHFETVIQPLPAGKTQHITVEPLQSNTQTTQTCAALACGNDLFLISYDGPTDISCDGVQFSGTALLLQRDEQRRPLQAFMVDGKSLMIGGKSVFSPQTPAPAHSLDLSMMK
ncbi:MAG: alginate lyase family protein [Candidatus Sumerlaeota bacterium]|nr:alginate lyase family protein [Candidatus Sumerlaeota bacterium]